MSNNLGLQCRLADTAVVQKRGNYETEAQETQKHTLFITSRP